jgi:arabinogalactan endo-1,4-beta-galactosidase
MYVIDRIKLLSLMNPVLSHFLPWNRVKKISRLFYLFALFVVLGCKKNDNNTITVPLPNDTIPAQTVPPGFAKGADISWLTQMESSGYSFYDSTGTKMDCMQILKNLGFNSIRLRAWVNPTNGWCNTADLVAKAIRANHMGFKILIDFHYSDVWADPGHQAKPLAWAGLDFTSLTDTVYSYTFHVMDTLKSNGINPVWVQVGNETNDGMLWEDGRASTNMQQFAALINAGYNAVKSVNDSTKVIVHISNGYDNILFRWMFDGLTANGASFDVIGMSLYPTSANWSSLDAQCLTNMNDMVSRYGKYIMISEIGMDVNSPSSCRSFIADMVSKTVSLPNGKGLGVFYWEPESYNWQGYTLGAFDNNGKPTSALYGFSDK